MGNNTANNEGMVFEKLLHLACTHGASIKFFQFQSNAQALVKGNSIGINPKLSINDINYNLAHELAHLFLHFDKGDTIQDDKHEEYEEQADRAAKMLLLALQEQG